MALTKSEKDAGKDVFSSLIPALFFDAWILMLALGGISHRQHIPHLALDYFTCLLINIVAVAILPQGIRTAAYLKQIMLKVERS